MKLQLWVCVRYRYEDFLMNPFDKKTNTDRSYAAPMFHRGSTTETFTSTQRRGDAVAENALQFRSVIIDWSVSVRFIHEIVSRPGRRIAQWFSPCWCLKLHRLFLAFGRAIIPGTLCRGCLPTYLLHLLNKWLSYVNCVFQTADTAN